MSDPFVDGESNLSPAGDGSEFATRAGTDLNIGQLLAERDRLLDVHRQVAELLGSKDNGKILHDLRNLLNEVQLLRILAKLEEE